MQSVFDWLYVFFFFFSHDNIEWHCMQLQWIELNWIILYYIIIIKLN
jgi:hypothetical protein